jgi:hypothetical protein
VRALTLYARSRALPATLVALVAAALLTAWVATRPAVFLDPQRRLPLLSLAPLLASAAIGTSLHQDAQEIDGTAVRPWWRLRLSHVLGLTVLAAAALALSVPGHGQEFGAAAMVRNTLGATGITAGAAVVVGARLSWLPALVSLGALFMSSASPALRSSTVVSWPVQPGPEPGAWAVAGALFAAGVGLYALLGARREAGRA